MKRYAKFLAILAVVLLSAPSALGVKQSLSATRGEIAGWLAAIGIELAYLSLAFIEFNDERKQRLAARIARSAVLASITLNVIADYTVRVPGGLSSSAMFLATFDWLLLSLSLLESAPLAGLAYTIAILLHQQHNPQNGGPDEPDRLMQAAPMQAQTQEVSAVEVPAEKEPAEKVPAEEEPPYRRETRTPAESVTPSPTGERPATNPAPPLLSLVREVIAVTGDQTDYVTTAQVYDRIRDKVGAINPTLRNEIARCLRGFGATVKRTEAGQRYHGIKIGVECG